ncbi:MAG: DinB family protein [Gemmatimonadetes bacterium]|nr:DinB family protein [Gemmatimonadota bacterium]
MDEKDFDLGKGIEVLQRTPGIIRAWLEGLSPTWIDSKEGPETWSPFDVLGHLIHGERTDWIPRAQQIVDGKGHLPFPPFDRFAQFRESEGKTLKDLLDDFEEEREKSLRVLRALDLTDAELDLTGTHPEFGAVTLRQLLATWVTHDLGHLAQIARVMARQNSKSVGPWAKYLSILHRP